MKLTAYPNTISIPMLPNGEEYSALATEGLQSFEVLTSTLDGLTKQSLTPGTEGFSEAMSSGYEALKRVLAAIASWFQRFGAWVVRMCQFLLSRETYYTKRFQEFLSDSNTVFTEDKLKTLLNDPNVIVPIAYEEAKAYIDTYDYMCKNIAPLMELTQKAKDGMIALGQDTINALSRHHNVLGTYTEVNRMTALLLFKHLPPEEAMKLLESYKTFQESLDKDLQKFREAMVRPLDQFGCKFGPIPSQLIEGELRLLPSEAPTSNQGWTPSNMLDMMHQFDTLKKSFPYQDMIRTWDAFDKHMQALPKDKGLDVFSAFFMTIMIIPIIAYVASQETNYRTTIRLKDRYIMLVNYTGKVLQMTSLIDLHMTKMFVVTGNVFKKHI